MISSSSRGRFSFPRWRISLRACLTALVLGVLIPVIAAVATSVWHAGATYKQQSLDRLLATAQTLALSVQHEIATRRELVQALAQAPEADLPALKATLSTGAFGQVLSPDNTPSPLPQAWQNANQQAFTQGRAVVSNLFTLPNAPENGPMLAFVAPRTTPQGLRPTVLLASPGQAVRALREPISRYSDLLFAITDGNGLVVARSQDAERFVGRKVPGWENLKALSRAQGTFVTQAIEGHDILLAFHRLEDTPGWMVVVGEPLQHFDERWMSPLATLAGTALLAIVLALLLAHWLSQRVLRPVRGLVDHARQVARDAQVSDRQSLQRTVAPSAIAEFETLRTSLIAADHALAERAAREYTTAQALAASERRYRAMAEAGALVFWQRAPNGALILATGWRELTGEPEHTAEGAGWLDRVHPDDQPVVAVAWERATHSSEPLDSEFRIKSVTGAWRWVRGRGASVRDDRGTIVEWVGVLEDVDERRQSQARIAHIAHHDALTDLPNRVLFRERLEQAVALAARGQPSAVLCIDLDRFKEVNDTLGHPVGDALLCAVTQHLLDLVRDTDTVARLGGDEFAIVQTAIAHPRDAAVLATRVVDTLSTPYTLHNHQVCIGASVGITLVIDDSENPDQILKKADLALYRAKDDGRGRHRFFEPDMDARMQERRRTELQLRHAFHHGELTVLYQPVVNLRSRAISGFEAQLRWRHPERGLLPPSAFLPLADDIGLSRPIGEWMLRQACRDAAAWPEGGRLSIDLWPIQVTNPNLITVVADALRESGLTPSRLELEVVEQALLDNKPETLDTLHNLKALGVRIAMDKFGSGYSSLGYLRRFPFDKVKIDETSIAALGEKADGQAMVRAITGLCGSLGITTTAEGVATEAQCLLLEDENCTEVQGTLFSAPCTADDVVRLYQLAGMRED